MRARYGCAAASGSLLLMALAGCEARNLGKSPPGDRFFFPSGVMLDPVARVEAPSLECTGMPERELDLPGPRYLYVANGNNDRAFNAGTLLAIDLQAFWRAWYDPHLDDPAQASCLEAIEAGSEQAACEACAARDPRRGGVDPYCHTGLDDGAHGRCVAPPGSSIEDSETAPCRRLPLVPRVAECDELPFVARRPSIDGEGNVVMDEDGEVVTVASTVHVGDFATTMTSSIENGKLRIWLPVRGDPSITYVDVGVDGDWVSLECGQGSDPLDRQLCGDSHRLDALRNDTELPSLDREPFNSVVWETERPSGDPEARGERLLFTAHAAGSQMSMVDLDGIRGGSEPAIVDLANVYQTSGSAVGGYGLAVRPCFAEGQGPLGEADPDSNIPTLTHDCTRPLVYTSFRLAGQLASFTASGLELGGAIADVVPPSERTDCTVPLLDVCTRQGEGESTTLDCPEGIEPRYTPEQASQCLTDAEIAAAAAADPTAPPTTKCTVYAGQYCATPDQLEQPCAVLCEPRVRGARRILPSLLLDTSGTSAAVLGAMAFGDPRGDQLLVLQTNPGALLSLDTSLDVGAEPLDIPSAPPVEICAEPSNMKVYIERDADGVAVQRYAIISCFRAALVYIVDLEALRVVDAVVVGTGPHDIAIDEDREVAYVINNLESSISVVDLSRRRATRFQELARLGLQDPFTQ